MVACLTPTGDRPEALALSRQYFERARDNYGAAVKWVVVDDGVTPFDPGGCIYLRREPDGPNSLGRNLLHGFKNAALEAEEILMWEDDDWYAATRITNQVKQLNRWGLHGYGKSIYYNVPLKGVHVHSNFLHSSLFETAMRREVAQTFVEIIKTNPDAFYLDILLWKLVKGKVAPHSGECIGIKGMKGRAGLGCGHVKNQLAYTPADLKDYIGDDAKNYYPDIPGPTARLEDHRLERDTNVSELWVQRP